METKINVNVRIINTHFFFARDGVILSKLLFLIAFNGLMLNCGWAVLMFIQEAVEDDVMHVRTSHLQ